MQDLLAVAGLCKSYGNFALRDVSFRLLSGGITGFIGRNGAGKTTTIRVLLGLSPYSAGRISFFGAAGSAADPKIRERLGVVLDGGGFFDELRANEMKKIVAPAYPRWSDADFHRYMDLFSLDASQRLSTYSRGMRAKFALALALSHQAELLIMDEPTSGLDPMIRRELLDVLRDFVSGGEERAVLFSTHITSDLDRIADDIILMEEGQIMLQRNRDDLLETHRLVKGRTSQLTPELRRLVGDLNETPYGFTGITADVQALQRLAPDIVLERPALEDIMAMYAGGRESRKDDESARIAV